MPSQRHIVASNWVHRSVSGTDHQDRMATQQEQIGAFTHDGVPRRNSSLSSVRGSRRHLCGSVPVPMNERCLAKRGDKHPHPSDGLGWARVEGNLVTSAFRSMAGQARSRAMAGFKSPDFLERQEAAAKARKAALQKFLAKAADPALATADGANSGRCRAPGGQNCSPGRKGRNQSAKCRTRAQGGTRRRFTGRARQGRARPARARLASQTKAGRDARYAARKTRSKRK